MDDLALVIDQILHRQYRRDYFVCGAEVIKLATGQGQYRHRERSQVGVRTLRLIAQSTSEIGIEVIIDHFALLCGFLPQQRHCTVRKQPDAYIGQVEMVFEQLSQCFD